MPRSSSSRILLSTVAAALFAVAGQAQQSTATTPTQVTPTTTTASVLPLAKMGDLSALLLDGGLLLHRLDGGSPAWLFAYGRHDGKTSFLHLSAFADGADTGYAIGSLTAFYRFSDADVKTLISYADGADLSKTDGVWAGLSKSEAYTLAADPVLGDLGAKLNTALIFLDTTKNLTATSSSLVASGATLCGAVEAVAYETVQATTATAFGGNVEGVVSAAQAVTTAASTNYNNTTFSAQAKLYCAGGWPPPAGTTPAFPPASPGFTPPTGPVKWSGTGCGADQVGDSASCINSNTGQLCSCTCSPIGQGFSWKPTSSTCAAIPVTPGPGATGGPGPCSPVGGSGPCSDASGATCICPCVTGPGGTGGVWGTPTSCPSGSAPLAVLFVLLAVIAAWRARH